MSRSNAGTRDRRGRRLRDLGRTTLAGALIAGLLGLPACAGYQCVDHTRDVELLLADNPQLEKPGFQPVPEEELVRLEQPPLEPYRLGVGDVVYVAVPDQEKFVKFGETSAGDIVGSRIKEDGNLYLPLVKKVPAEGKTALELQEEIEKRLETYITDPFVSVDVIRYESQRFYVLGEVMQPGAQPVDGRTTLVDAITQAGGPNNGNADLDTAYVIRDGQTLPISIADVLKRGDVAGNVRMRNGDIVFVPKLYDTFDKVFIFGEVKSPGAVRMPQEGDLTQPGTLTLAEALAEVGGLDPTTAAQEQIRIFRGGWKHPVAYTLGAHEVYKYGDCLYLKPGDRVFVAPTGLATWGRALQQGLPFITGTSNALSLALSAAALAK